MASMQTRVRALRSLLQGFLEFFGTAEKTESADVSDIFRCAKALEESLKQDFEITYRRKWKNISIRQIQKKLQKANKQKEILQERLKKETAARVSGRIAHIWYVRTGLADPTFPLEALSQWCSHFPAAGTKAISSTYIAAVKDAFAEILKSPAKKTIGISADNLKVASDLKTSEPVIVRHLHDEATMKLRSYRSDTPCRPLPTKYSKIQNNVVHVRVGDCTHGMFTELQCVQTKDAVSIASCLVSVCESVINGTTREWDRLRLIHCVTGDSINTNEAACRRLLAYFLQSQRRFPQVPQYSLLVTKCASHQANLVVQVAVVGGMIQDPVNQCDLTAACSRWTFRIWFLCSVCMEQQPYHVTCCRSCHLKDSMKGRAKQNHLL